VGSSGDVRRKLAILLPGSSYNTLLIVHGTADDALPAFLADQTFVARRRLGKEVVYAKYQGEEHYERNFSDANAVDYANRVITWFDT